MIASLVRSDPSRRTVLAFVLVGVVSGVVLRGIRVAVPEGVAIPVGGGTAGLAMLLAATSLWGMAVAFLMKMGVATKGSLVSLALPLPARTIWTARVVSIVTAVAIPVVAMTLVAAVGLDENGLPTLHAATVALGVRLFASLLLLVALLQAHRPDLRTPPRGVVRASVTAGSLVAAFVVAYLPVAPWPVVGLTLGATIVLIVQTYRRLPRAFSLVGAELAAGPPARALSAVPETPPRGSAVRRTLARVFVSHPQAWFALPLLAFYGFQSSLTYHEGRDPLLVLVFPALWIPFVVVFSMSRMGSLDPLPIPRRRLFRWIVAPSVLVFLLGWALHAPIARVFDAPYSLVRVDRRGARVPTEFWELSSGGTPPAVAAPWGESRSPRGLAVFPGSAISVYNPFDSPPESTPRYTAWQLRRAVAAVRGGDPSAVPVPDPLDPLVENVRSRDARGARQVVEEAVGLGSSRHARTQLVVGLLPLAFWLPFGWIGMHPRWSGRSRSIVLILGLTIPLVLVLGAEFAAMSSGLASAPSTIAVMVLSGKAADAFPFGTIALAASVALAAVAVYRLLGRAFERFEAPVRPAKSLLTGCEGSDPM